jgi:hypothetical protein
VYILSSPNGYRPPHEAPVSRNLAAGKTLDVTCHQREVIIIAQQQLALACARSLCEPENEKWAGVITRLSGWLARLQRRDGFTIPLMLDD